MLASLLLGCLLLPASWAGDDEAPEIPAEAYALVGEDPILRTAVAEEARHRSAPPGVILEAMIDVAVWKQKLLEKGRDPAQVSQEEVDEILEGYADDNALGEFSKWERRALRTRLAFSDYIRSRLTRSYVKDYFEENRLLFAGFVRARHIFLPTSAQGPIEFARAEALLNELREDPSDEHFAAVARKRSRDPWAPLTGGDLDWFGPDGHNALGLTLPPQVVRASFELGKEGLVEHVVSTTAGYHVVRVVATRYDNSVTFQSVYPRLRSLAQLEMAQQTMKAWRAEVDVVYAADAPRATTPR